MRYLKNMLKKIYYWFFVFCDPIEWLSLLSLRASGRLITIKQLKRQLVAGSDTMFAFGTGGSVSNLKHVGALVDEFDSISVTTGPIEAFIKYGCLPKYWFIHNPDSVQLAIERLSELQSAVRFDFSDIFILIPSNFSFNSKRVHFSSKIIRKFRRALPGYPTFVTYHERFTWPALDERNNVGFGDPLTYPLVLIDSTTVEGTFFPVASFLGYKNIIFSGVDHLNTGHFWDLSRPYQDLDGTVKEITKVTDKNLIELCQRYTLKKCHQFGISLYRLEKEMTALKIYPWIDEQSIKYLSNPK
jgi:hypothetical protein